VGEFFGTIFYRRVGDLEWCGVFQLPSSLHSSSQPSQFQPSSLRTTLLSSPLPSSRLLSNHFYPILLFTLLKPLPPADAYTLPRSHIHHPLHPCPAQTSYRDIQKGRCLKSPRFELAGASLRPRSFKNKVEDELEGRSGGIDRGVADG